MKKRTCPVLQPVLEEASAPEEWKPKEATFRMTCSAGRMDRAAGGGEWGRSGREGAATPHNWHREGEAATGAGDPASRGAAAGSALRA